MCSLKCLSERNDNLGCNPISFPVYEQEALLYAKGRITDPLKMTTDYSQSSKEAFVGKRRSGDHKRRSGKFLSMNAIMQACQFSINRNYLAKFFAMLIFFF